MIYRGLDYWNRVPLRGPLQGVYTGSIVGFNDV